MRPCLKTNRSQCIWGFVCQQGLMPPPLCLLEAQARASQGNLSLALTVWRGLLSFALREAPCSGKQLLIHHRAADALHSRISELSVSWGKNKPAQGGARKTELVPGCLNCPGSLVLLQTGAMAARSCVTSVWTLSRHTGIYGKGNQFPDI